MPIPTLFTDLSTTASSNSPGSGETPAEGDNHLRQVYAFLRSIMANSGNGWTSPYVASSSLPTLTSGTYTPTVTGVSNVDSVSAYSCIYMRVGSVVQVSGTISVNPTTNGIATSFDVSLPVASNFTAVTDCAGVVGVQSTGVAYGGEVDANTTDDRAAMRILATGTGAGDYYFIFSYVVA
jgi:hypothetical protein